jgi:protein involved in polysaccharide export with SLBB domain
MKARLRFRWVMNSKARQDGKRIPRICWVCVGLLLYGLPAGAQNQTPKRAPGSELGHENLSRVAASATEIKIVLVRNTGIMVELKRWVAKDATDHGQIVSDADLTDNGIFDRLETDVQFRSVATALLQRYGYLVPRVNPESEQGKEHELLIQERAKWMAQHAEERRAAEHARTEENLRNTHECAQGNEQSCIALERRPESVSGFDQEDREDGQTSPSPLLPNQGGPWQPEAPRGPTSPLDRTQLMQASEQEGTDFSLGNLLDSMQAPGSSATNSVISQGLLLQQTGMGGHAPNGSSPSRGNVDLQAALLDLSAGETSTEGAFPGGSTNSPELGGVTGRAPPTAGYSQTFPSMDRMNGQVRPKAPASPQLVRKAAPYDDIPSLYDMYMQAVPRPPVPRRFGMDVFESKTRDRRLIPMDLPAGPDYVVGPGDGLTIDLWGGISRRISRIVDREGRVSLPEVGPVLVSGKSLADVQVNLQQILRTQFRDVSADVSLGRLRTIRVYEVGDVVNPGAYDISSLSTPLNALFNAGGPTPRGSLRIVKHYRGNELLQVVDVYDLLLHGVKGNLERLENGDTVLVPPIGAQVVVDGMVRRPAIYELNDEKNLESVLELAGGLLPSAALRHIEVERTVAHEKKTMLSFDIPEADVGNSLEVTKRLASFEVHDGDRIRVFPIAPYNQDAIYLEGHVIRQGRYSFRDGMRVTDVIGSYKDLLPEPASTYAEIIRLNAPDFHPTVESFDLAGALAIPGQAPLLHPLDTIRVFSRFDFENPPTVSVWGDVRAPGTYRTSGQIRLTDAVHQAGGLAPDAQTSDAQVFRYLPDGKMRIFSVSLSGALAGDPSANILLEPRDRLLIHRNPEAIAPASAYLEGEVGNPGRYPLTTNMTVRDLIMVGGGLKSSADAQTADLTHYQYNGSTLTGQHEAISISAALAGDATSNPPLHNGDVLSVRQLPSWNDLGASIAIKGEVNHPGSYGIRPGERLSSVLERAGGFQPSAYPYGAILQRAQVRELEMKQRDETILRVKDQQNVLEAMPEGDLRQKQVKEAALQQYRATLTQLSANPPVGRVDIKISSNITQWKNTTNDVQVRAGDMLIIPKAPSYVMVTGQVFNPTAVSYRPGKSAKWYLGQSGGPTQMASKKAIFVIRADGSVIGSKDSAWSGSSLGAVLHPGDTVVVPEKAIGPGVNWQNIFAASQVASAIASTVFIALRY